MKKPLNLFSDSEESSSVEMSNRSDSQNFEKELYDFINENKGGFMQRLKAIPALGMILGIMSVIFQLGMFTNVKILYNSTSMTAFEIIYMRGITDLILTVITCRALNVNYLGIEEENRGAIRIRMFFAAASAFFAFLTLKVNPISLATTLTFTSPIFTCIFAFFAIGEKISRYDVGNIFWWIVGVIMISNPFGDVQGNTSALGIVIGILAAITVAASFTMVRVVALNLHFLVPMFYYWLATTAFAPIAYTFMLANGHQPTVYSWSQLLRILILCIFGFFSQLFLNASYKVEKAGRVSSVRYLQVVLSFLVDVMLFKTSFSTQEIIGAWFIVISNFTIVILKWTGRIS